MTIASILANKGSTVISLGANARLSDAVALLAEKRIGAVPVLKEDRVVGILSERDVLYSVARDGAAALDQPVESVMTAPAIDVAPDVPILAALSLMTRRRIRHLPVLEGGRLIGFVSIGDLVKARVDRIEQEAAAMREYIQSA